MHRLTLTVARLGGVPLRIHLSWLLLLGWIGWVALGLPGHSAWRLLTLTLLLTGCVFVHELAHACAGRALGLRATSVTLYPFGGLSTFHELPAAELRTALVFLAGPTANLALAAGCWSAVRPPWGALLETPSPSDPLLLWLAWFNLSLGLLNLAPILPLDGGQVLRTLLARRAGELQAARILGMVGQIVGIVTMAWGFAGRPWLILAGLIVLVGATAELQRVHPLILASSQRVRDVMRTTIVAVDAATPTAQLREVSRGSPGADFVLLVDGRPSAYLPAARLWRGQVGDHVPAASQLAEPLGPAVGPEELLATALAAMERNGSQVSPVLDPRGNLAGVLVRAAARRSLSLLQALSRRSSRRGPNPHGTGQF